LYSFSRLDQYPEAGIYLQSWSIIGFIEYDKAKVDSRPNTDSYNNLDNKLQPVVSATISLLLPQLSGIADRIQD
jgi:hypothetical protein